MKTKQITWKNGTSVFHFQEKGKENIIAIQISKISAITRYFTLEIIKPENGTVKVLNFFISNSVQKLYIQQWG